MERLVSSRRDFLKGLGLALIAAPAVIRTPGLLMSIVHPEPNALFTDEAEWPLKVFRYVWDPRSYAKAQAIEWGDPVRYA